MADHRHVWALRVPEYERVAQERWSKRVARERSPTDRADHLESGITLFNGSGRAPEVEFVNIVATVELHHGVYSHVPAVSEVEVFGAQPTAEVRAELSHYGFDDVSPSQRGFTARRAA
jgi:hypothetical protein